MEYKEQIQDKRWKIRRIEILKRDRFTCQICGYMGDRVNIHHLKYSGKAWEAPDEDLITLCYGCHRTVHQPDLNDKKLDRLHIGSIIKNNYG